MLRRLLAGVVRRRRRGFRLANVLLRLLIEGPLAARSAEVVLLPMVGGLVHRRLLFDFHAANRVGRHFTSFHHGALRRPGETREYSNCRPDRAAHAELPVPRCGGGRPPQRRTRPAQRRRCAARRTTPHPDRTEPLWRGASWR